MRPRYDMMTYVQEVTFPQARMWPKQCERGPAGWLRSRDSCAKSWYGATGRVIPPFAAESVNSWFSPQLTRIRIKSLKCATLLKLSTQKFGRHVAKLTSYDAETRQTKVNTGLMVIAYLWNIFNVLHDPFLLLPLSLKHQKQMSVRCLNAPSVKMHHPCCSDMVSDKWLEFCHHRDVADRGDSIACCSYTSFFKHKRYNMSFNEFQRCWSTDRFAISPPLPSPSAWLS